MKILAVLYPGNGAADQNPDLLGCAENALGLRPWLEEQGHELITLTDPDEAFDQRLPEADVVIATPFWPTYLTRERLERARNLKLVLTAGVGSDHIDLSAAAEKGISVAEISGSNVVSVAEHAVMQILALVRNFMPAYQDVVDGGWSIGKIAARSHDLEDKTVGIVGMGRIGQRTARRLQPFDVTLLYYDNQKLSTVEEQVLDARYTPLRELVERSDVISIHVPLTPATQGLFDHELLRRMKEGAWLVNTARGAIVDQDALVEALESGRLGGYAGDVWYPQPAPADHPWRRMPRHAMTPHVSGTSLEAQARYAKGIRRCLERFFEGWPLDSDYIIVEGGKVASPSYAYAYESR